MYPFMIKKFKYIYIVLVACWLADFSSGLFHICLDHRKIDAESIPLKIKSVGSKEKYKTTWKAMAYSFQYSHHLDPHDLIKDSNIFLNPDGQEGLWLLWIVYQIQLLILKNYFKLSLSRRYMIATSIQFLLINLWAKDIISATGMYGFPVLVTFVASNLLKGNDNLLHIFMQTYLFFANTSQIYHGLAHMVTRKSQGKKINHRIQPNYKVIKFLQKYHLIISAKEHSKHHETANSNFAIVNGWSNKALNKLFNKVFLPIMKKYPKKFVVL